MLKNKLQFDEENGSSRIEINIRRTNNKNLNNSFDLNERESCKNYSKENDDNFKKKQVRGRQLHTNNIYSISKNENSSIFKASETKKRSGKKSMF